MKRKYVVLTLSMAVLSASAFAKEKIDWKICDKELKEFCTTIRDDHEKHECLEEAPKGKVSKSCAEFNAKLEGKFEDKHKHGEKHNH